MAVEVAAEVAAVVPLDHLLVLEAAAVVAAAQERAAKRVEVAEAVVWPARGGMVRRYHKHPAPATTMR